MRISYEQVSHTAAHRSLTRILGHCGVLFLILGFVCGTGKAYAAESGTGTGANGGKPKLAEKPRDILKDYPAGRVTERLPVLSNGEFYPCSDCHNDDQPADPKVRDLEEEHDTIELKHGGGKFWCLACHNKDDRDTLQSVKGEPVSFDESFLVCMQCHPSRQEHFFEGGHGMRIAGQQVAGQQVEKAILACTECHDPHGTDNFRMLRAPYPDQEHFYAPFGKGDGYICLKCHDKGKFEEKNGNTGFKDKGKNLHFKHVNRKKGRTCRACHDPHSSDNEHMLRTITPFGDWEFSLNWKRDPKKGASCTPACHDQRFYDGAALPGVLMEPKVVPRTLVP